MSDSLEELTIKIEEKRQGSWLRNLLWQLPLLAVVCLSGDFASKELDREIDKFMPEAISNCSSYNRQASGYRACYELCRKSGLNCARWEKSYRELDSEKGLLLIIAPTYLMMPYEVDRILGWVSKGNRLVYLDYCIYGSGKHLLDKLGLTAASGRSLDNMQISKLPEIPEMEHVNKLVLSSESRLKGGTTILEENNKPSQGGSLMVTVNYGKGSCLIATLPNLCANYRISDKSNWGNFQFLVNWLNAASCKILFDEKVHGHSSNRNFYAYIARGPAGLIATQLTIILLTAIFSLNQRFGKVKTLDKTRKIAASEHIDGMARTYRKAGAFNAALAIIYGSFKLRLTKALSLAPDENIEKIASCWTDTGALTYEESSRFLQHAEGLQRVDHLSEEEMLACLKDCDRLYEKSKEKLPLHAQRRLGG